MLTHLHFPLVVIVSFAVGISAVLLFLLVRKFILWHALTSHHEVAFPIFLQIGVIFAVILAFIFSLTWERFYDTYKNCQEEAVNLLTLAELAKNLPQPLQKKVLLHINHYIDSVINEEWPDLAQHKENLHTSKALEILQKDYFNFFPKNDIELTLYSESLEHLSTAIEYRQMRIFQVTELSTIGLIYFLSFYGIVIVSISFLFGMKNALIQAILIGFLAMVITSIITIIYIFIHPFSNQNIAIHTRAFQEVLKKSQMIDHDLNRSFKFTYQK